MVRFFRKCCSSALVWSFATTGLRFGGVLLVLPIVLRAIPQDQLGLYYVFQSLGIFGALLDMGLAPTIGRSVSYLWAGAPTLEKFGVSAASESKEPNWKLLNAVFDTFRQFYWYAGLVLLLILGIGCIPYIWHITTSLKNPQEGRIIWILLSIGSAWNFAGSVWPAMLGGINRVRSQQVGQLIAIAIGYAVTVTGLLLGIGLWALALSMIIQAALQRQISRAMFCRAVEPHLDSTHQKFDWDLFKTLWPSSWRTGIITVTVSLYLSAPVFFVSSFIGLKAAGEIGLSMQLAMSVVQISTVVVYVKAPLFSILRINGRMKELRAVFAERLSVFLGLFLVGSSMVVLFGNWILHHVIHSRTPMPDPEILILILTYAGMEGLQANFRGLAHSANITNYWKIFLFGSSVSCLLGFWALHYGVVNFLITLLTLKFLLVDGLIIMLGIRTLEISAASFLKLLIKAPGELLRHAFMRSQKSVSNYDL